MNERIRELVKEAGGEFWQRLENDIVNPEAFVSFDPPESVAKFAELIVRECMGCSDWVGGANKNPVEPVHTARAINKRIKEHFGVE